MIVTLLVESLKPKSVKAKDCGSANINKQTKRFALFQGNTFLVSESRFEKLTYEVILLLNTC